MEQPSANITNRTIAPMITPITSNRGVLVIQATGKPKIPTVPPNGISNQGVATLIVMCCVLTIIMMFCCFAAPGIRDLCKRYVFRQCVIDDPDVNNVQTPQQHQTPTLILLPFGRMLVVDRSMFQAFQSDPTGLDLLEIGRHIMRNQSLISDSTPSVLDCDSTSKGLTPDSLDLQPPSYDEVLRKDLPPAYSELSLMFRTQRYPSSTYCASTQSIELDHLRERHLESETDLVDRDLVSK
ncbi:uncharacterized protein LOC123307822 [Coccinella septempunctata]|uniref:uncharacterized protein LOC123307822 n=1 Tax=Coccinella septempunctata TaxID=41139 RepID=UPI001D070D40|nr:uncharacterized protein LOC123307822 [Coccinella septempunctata]